MAALASLDALERRLADPAAEATRIADIGQLTEWLTTCVSPEGLFLAAPWHSHRLLPPLDRIRNACRDSGWTADHEQWLARVVGATIRTSHRAGWVFSHEPRSANVAAVIEQLFAEPDWRSWRNVGRWLWGIDWPEEQEPPPAPGFECDAARTAVLRRDWSAAAAIVALDFRHEAPAIELRLGTHRILHGPWRLGVAIDGEALAPLEPWQATCWFTDRDGEYLELRLKLEHAVIDRQIFLCRPCELVLLADTLTVDKPGHIDLRWELPLAGPAELVPDRTTAAVDLKCGRSRVRVVPVGLPAEAPRPPDAIQLTEGFLRLRTRGERRIHFPVALTWGRGTRTKPQPWRPLTITNNRRQVAAGEAVAYRLPVADQQVVYFRTLEWPLRYAFLGHQTLDECVIGRLSGNGEFQEWLVVEWPGGEAVDCRSGEPSRTRMAVGNG